MTATSSSIKKIFQKNNIDIVKLIQKVNIGFTNEIYSINDKYILKICMTGIQQTLLIIIITM